MGIYGQPACDFCEFPDQLGQTIWAGGDSG